MELKKYIISSNYHDKLWVRIVRIQVAISAIPKNRRAVNARVAILT